MRAIACLAAACAALPAPAALAAGWECRFTTESLDADPCAATDYAFTLEAEEGRARFVTPAETVEGTLGVTPSGATHAVGAAGAAVHLLTLMDADGTARYTVHLAEAGLSITYLGSCEAE